MATAISDDQTTIATPRCGCAANAATAQKCTAIRLSASCANMRPVIYALASNERDCQSTEIYDSSTRT
ncbi:uncharacterized protein DSM5745_07650 [Aspergillus mulundensis]|uniref:Uncharacterized protein n=1 Tax=Aspergillus mulundensis TaxID=1810919 RepID=A0A3D8REX7_9EURO|nr:hypothetical protein DSM5745_07650 [Aspergillus mulundensis]RDW72478.1 hypothetical protein DSM5745_07650 [Aspergillus mulundensis]